MADESIIRACTYVQKGGVGKTTSAAHIGVAASQEHDLDVLLIDLAGTQNDLSTQFGIELPTDGDGNIDLDAPISAVFGSDWEFIVDNIPDVADRMIFETDEGPDVIPADPGLGGADNNLANVPREERYDKLEAFIENQIAPRYDAVLLDLPGKEDNVALNGLFAAENTIAPLQPGAFEREQLQNLDADLATLREEYPVDPVLAMITPTMIDGRRNMHEDFVAELRDAYPDLTTPEIPATADIGNEQANGRTLFALEDDELYTTGKRARDAYRELTADLIDRLEAR